MKILNININDNIVEIDREVLTSGTFNYIKCCFYFSEEWDEYDKIAIFTVKDKAYKKAIVDDECIIPQEVAEAIEDIGIGVYGNKIIDGVLDSRCTTKIDYFYIHEGSYIKDALESEALADISSYELYISKMNEILEETKKALGDTVQIKTDIQALATQVIEQIRTQAKASEDKAIENIDKEYQSVLERIEQVYITKKTEIDEVAKDVAKMKASVETSEENAKVSETNAKTSEINALNSANKAAESESNVIAIEKNIEGIQADVQANKEVTDTNVTTTNNNAAEATKQAGIATQQATLSTQNANKTSEDKTSVETMKNDVTIIKTSVEQAKTEVESARDDTLEAKEAVESSLENERIEIDKRYAKAIESDEIVVDEFAQVELDEDGYMKDVCLESKGEISQAVREGYNILDNQMISQTLNDVNFIVNEDKSIKMKGTATVRTEPVLWQKSVDNSLILKAGVDYFNATARTLYVFGGGSLYYSINANSVLKPSVDIDVNRIYFRVEAGESVDTTIYSMIVEGTEAKPYEAFGISPSLNYPSEFENVLKNIKIGNSNRNLFNIENLKNGTWNSSSNIRGVMFTNFKIKTGHKITVHNYNKNYKYAVGFTELNTNSKDNISINESGWQTLDFYSISPIRSGFLFLQIAKIDDSAIDVFELKESDFKIEIDNESVDFVNHKGYTKNIALSEDKFLGKFAGYENKIENGALKEKLKIITFDGTENWFLANNVFYIQDVTDYKRGWEVIGICNYFPVQSSVGVSSNLQDNRVSFFGGGSVGGLSRIYVHCSSFEGNIDNFKNWLAEKYEEGNPLQIIYILGNEAQEELSSENKNTLNSLQVYENINNISVENCILKFKTNRNIEKYVEEKNVSEREISDSKYARALKTTVSNVGFSQVYVENEKPDMLQINGAQLTQETREGYNLFNPNAVYPITQSGVTVNKTEDGAIVLNGTATENANVKLDLGYTVSEQEIMTGKNYSLKIVANGEGSLKNIGLKYAGNSDRFTIQNVENGEYSKTGIYTKQEIDTGKLYNAFYFLGGTIFNNYTIYITLVEGTEVKEYEQYGASPSLNYPSEVQAVGEQNIQINKENYFNTNQIANKAFSNSGLTITIDENGIFEVNGTHTEQVNINFNSLDFNIKENQRIKLVPLEGSVNYQENILNCINTLLWNKDWKTLALLNLNNNLINSSDTVKYFQVRFIIPSQQSSITYTNFKFGIMIIDTNATDDGVYKKYDGKVYDITLDEQFNGAIDEYVDRIFKDEDGLWKIEKVIKELVLTENENWDLYGNGENKRLRFRSLINYIVKPSSSSEAGKILCNCYKVKSASETFKNIEGISLDTLGQILIFDDNYTTTESVETFKELLAQKYNAGTPVKIYYVSSIPEYILLSQENQDILNSFELQTGLNNITIDNGTFDLTYNEDLQHFLNEKFGNIESRLSALESQQVSQIGGE